MPDDTPRREEPQPPPVTAIVQARAGSSRLPGKIGAPIGDRSLLAWVVTRLREARRVGRIVVATTVEPADDATVAEATALGVDHYRGPVEDVLARFAGALAAFPDATFCRITADNPLLDPGALDLLIEAHIAGRGDHTGVAGTVPLGATAEVVSASALMTAHRESVDPPCREHVTPYLYTHPERFRLIRIAPPPPLVGRSDRLTIDTEEDLRFMRTLYDRLVAQGEPFAIGPVVRLLAAEPSLAAINAGVRQKGWRE
ncbi:MAG: glycosyltransferase family protein [Nitrospinae bacterium]|nr:glycosyltransferase family protein [Nitrospinota bacterium]